MRHEINDIGRYCYRKNNGWQGMRKSGPTVIWQEGTERYFLKSKLKREPKNIDIKSDGRVIVCWFQLGTSSFKELPASMRRTEL